MKNNITELVFILDRSGSMHGLEADTIGGFNSMLERQKEEAGKAYVSTLLFDGATKVIHDRVEISEVRPMTDKDYTIGGCTALMDALGGAINHIEMIHKYIRPEDVPENTLFVIITDGMENASQKFTADEVKKAVTRKKEENGWEFIFLGANIDAVETASRYGISADRAVDYKCDSVGTKVNFEAVSNAVSHMRCESSVAADWAAPIQSDFKRRRKK